MKPPIPHSYWVEPGVFLAGEHPDEGSPAKTRKRLAVLHGAGVRHFIDLTGPGEMPPYAMLLPPGARYYNFPIRDHSVPDGAALMREILATLAAVRSEGVYVHCRAGIGRTGITVGCYLRERGAGPDQAIVDLNRLWLQNARAARWPLVPETEEQEHFIRSWVAGVDRAATAAEVLPEGGGIERYRGCLLGLALGDALAAAGEAGEGTLAFTDDTAMTVCVADSLLHQDGFDGRDQLDRYLQWQRNPAASGAHPDASLPPSVRSTLLRALRSHAPLQGSHDPSVVDAAPLARSVAASLFAGADTGLAEELAEQVSRVTHQASVAVDCCRLLAVTLCTALQGSDRQEVAGAGLQLGASLREEVLQVAEGWAEPGGRRSPGPPILAALDRAVRAFLRTRDFTSGLARLQEGPAADRDATFAVFGALAGAWYGEAGLPAGLLARLRGREDLEELAAALHG